MKKFSSRSHANNELNKATHKFVFLHLNVKICSLFKIKACINNVQNYRLPHLKSNHFLILVTKLICHVSCKYELLPPINIVKEILIF